MSYVTLLNDGTRQGRKPHQCFDCYRTIPAGHEHRFSTCKYDHVYTLRMHLDCTAASEFYRKKVGLSDWDFDDGIPPLADIISDGGEFAADCDMLRGRFPHVVARLELTEQLAEIRLQNRLRERAI